MGRAPSFKHVAAIVPISLALTLSACGDNSDDNTVPVTPVVTPSAQPQLTDSEIVRAVEVRPDELPANYDTTNGFGYAGDVVEGQVTLDMCGANFPSEGLRTARHQVGYKSSAGGFISSETVTYEADGAAQAIGELRSAIASCPKGFVGSYVAGQSPRQQRFTEMPKQATWQEDSLALQFTFTRESGESLSGAMIYQRRGNVLSAVYVWDGPNTSAQLAASFATLLSQRLEAAMPVVAAAPASPGNTSTPTASTLNPCDLLTARELKSLAGGPVSAERRGLTSGLANCQWATLDGGFVQVIASASPDWAQSLPAAIRAFEASGLATDEEHLKKLHEGAALVEAGQELSPIEACSLFSDMLVLQGRPEGSSWTVTVAPTRADPQAVTGHVCTGGRFTSVTIGNSTGIQKPLPQRQVAQALVAAHRRNLG